MGKRVALPTHAWMEAELRTESLRARGTVVWPPLTTETTRRTGGRQAIISQPTRYRHGVKRNTEDYETVVETHGEERSDGTYYTKFALDGHVYRVDDEIAIEAEDGDEVVMRIDSLWLDRDGVAMVSLADEDADEDDEKVEEEIDNLKTVRPAVLASPTSATAVAAQPVPTATSYSASAYNASDLWLGIPRDAWRNYDNDFVAGARSKPRSAWRVQPPAAIADAKILWQWMPLMHQFGLKASLLDKCLNRSREYRGDRDFEVRACTEHMQELLEHLRELEAEAHMSNGRASGDAGAAAAEAAAAASVDMAIADVRGRHAAAAPPPPAPPRYTRRLAGLCISTEVERPTRLLQHEVVRLEICGGVGWRRSNAFPECEFHSTASFLCDFHSEEDEKWSYYVAVRSAGSSSAHAAAAAKPAKRPSQATAAQSAKKPRRMQTAPNGKAKAVEEPEPVAAPKGKAKAAKGKAKAAVEVAPAKPAKAPKGKAQAVAKAPKAPKAPKTYPAAIVAAVTTHGLLSRAAVTKQAAALGFDKASQITTALKKVLKDGLIEASGGSYTLGGTARAQLTPEAAAEYEAALGRAKDERETTREEKDDTRARADAKYAANLRAAGGLTVQAKQDRAWLQRHCV